MLNKFMKLLKNTSRSSTSKEIIANMQESLNRLDGNKVEFSVTTNDDGSWYAYSTNIDGIFTSGDKNDNISEMLKDAVFTFYEVPSAYADDRLLKSTGERVETLQLA